MIARIWHGWTKPEDTDALRRRSGECRGFWRIAVSISCAPKRPFSTKASRISRGAWRNNVTDVF
jgi:hypothetical protein